MKTHKFETYYGIYYCKKCRDEIINTLYFIGNDTSYCDKCFPLEFKKNLKSERKIKLKTLGNLK